MLEIRWNQVEGGKERNITKGVYAQRGGSKEQEEQMDNRVISLNKENVTSLYIPHTHRTKEGAAIVVSVSRRQ